ncbi:MAG: hypothetical protein IT489_03135 [Gammaproteobacteria bacterium]|nr:hypothetical protein [Gammaproteobacteria bacterium]
MIPLPPNTIDEAGHRYGRLVVLDYAGREGGAAAPHGPAVWRCRCDCGALHLVRGARLRAGRVVSCGCERSDPAIRQAARLKVPPKRRRAIAKLGAAARLRSGPHPDPARCPCGRYPLTYLAVHRKGRHSDAACSAERAE